MSGAEEVSTLEQDVRRLGENAQREFGKLSDGQLNWKPSVDRWSVAQCFDHLITTNTAYFPAFDSIAQGQKKTRPMERLPLLPSLWGKLLIKSLDPKTARKLKAPSVFQPSSSTISGSIVDDFVKNQNRVAESMEATKHLNVDGIVITSPAARVITYSLIDAYRIIVVHGQRHYLQAKRVTEHESFPSQ